MLTKRVVSKFPVVTTGLLEAANFSQLHRMWTERSALGQSIMGWSLVAVALWMWFIYYKVMLPAERITRYCQALGIIINLSVVLTVVYFRYIV